MTDSDLDFSDWVGRTERVDDLISPWPARAAAAMLDETTTSLAAGAPLPPLWHWFYFLNTAPQAKLGSDGHPERGDFLPPIPMPRRMFAGARLRFLRPLLIGQTATRSAVLRDVSMKSGRSGPLAFVTVAYRYEQEGIPCIEEEQDLVYRNPSRAAAPVETQPTGPDPEGTFSQTVTPDPRLLFRFSALTFNAHRIHYDRPYAVDVEGYPGLLVHGPLTAILLMQLARRGSSQPVREFSFRGKAPLFDLAPFRLIATPSTDAIGLEAVGPDGQAAMTAQAVLEKP